MHVANLFFVMPADDSDTEGTSPSLAKLSTSAGSSSRGGAGKKTERNFWQYNVQAKGPKGQKIVIETKIEDPHVLNDIVDPVFSGDVQLQVCNSKPGFLDGFPSNEG